MRHFVPEADAMLDVPVSVLDHGLVVPLDYMGSDLAIVDAARTSYGKQHYENDEKNRRLINRLKRDAHTSAFEMVEFKFFIKCPIFVWRQGVRHRTAHQNEFSMRYTEAPEEWYIPDYEVIQYQDKTNKQGRKELYDKPEEVVDAINEVNRLAFMRYHEMLANGVARELARTVLPVSVYTQVIWKIDLHNLLHFLWLRLDPHAQYEIQVFAKAMVPFVKAVCPMAWGAFEEHALYAHTLSRTEWDEYQEWLASTQENEG